MIDLNGQEEALALESCEDHSNYGEQEEEDMGDYEGYFINQVESEWGY